MIKQEAKASVKIGTSIMGAFTRMSVETDQLLREFIDNSTTSYYDHQDELNKVTEEKKCVVKIEWDDSRIVIEDNSYGMTLEDFLRAIRPNAKADHYSETSRGKYGLGLKYAALNMGGNYTIETTALGNNELYYTEIDLDLLNQDVEEVPYTISDIHNNKHYTKIVITKLAKTLKETKKKGQKSSGKSREDKLRESLSRIYQLDITEGKLDIYLNGKKIVYLEPELLQKKDGGEHFSTFDDCFEFGGKEYSYHGWIGILKRGNVSDAGFMLVQKERAIQLNYRPEELFGKSNDFRYQRIIGEINLDGESWVVTFTKDAIKWDDFGLEDIFIQSLKDNYEIKKMLDFAKSYRKGNENVTVEKLEKWKKDITKSFNSSSEEKNNVIDDTVKNDKNFNDTISEQSSDVSSDSTEKKSQKSNDNKVISTSNDENNTENKDECKKENVTLPINYGGVDYMFELDPVIDISSDTPWVNTKAIDSENNKYRVEINVRSPFFEEYKDEKSKKLITKLAVCVSLAQLASKRSGLNSAESQKFVEELNSILATFNKGE